MFSLTIHLLTIDFRTLNFLLFLGLLFEYGRIKYPEQYNELLTKLMYNALYFYSISEELYTKHITPLFVYTDIVRNNIDIILDENGDNYITDTEELAIDKNIPTEYKFAIYTRLTNDNMVRKKRIYKRLPEMYDCDETSYKFILIEFVFDNKTCKIALSSAKSTYYVVNNEFDSLFFRYLLITEYDIQLPEHYTINILDQNVSKVELNETQVLRLNKDNYEVKTI